MVDIIQIIHIARRLSPLTVRVAGRENQTQVPIPGSRRLVATEANLPRFIAILNENCETK